MGGGLFADEVVVVNRERTGRQADVMLSTHFLELGDGGIPDYDIRMA